MRINTAPANDGRAGVLAVVADASAPVWHVCFSGKVGSADDSLLVGKSFCVLSDVFSLIGLPEGKI